MAFYRLDTDKDGLIFLNDFSQLMINQGFNNDPIKYERLYHFVDFVSFLLQSIISRTRTAGLMSRIGLGDTKKWEKK